MQNQSQLELIEALKVDLERMKKENDVYRTFNRSQKNTGNSQAILQSLIDKSEREYVNLKNLHLKKIEIVSQEEAKDEGPKKNEVVGEAIGNVS